MLGRNRVVITGLGVLAANGIGRESFWTSLLAGQSGIGPLSVCSPEGLSSRIAGEVSDFRPSDYLEGKINPRHLSRNTQLATAAAKLALLDAAIAPEHFHLTTPLAIELGISMSGFDLIEKEMNHFFNRGARFVMPSVVGCIHIASASTIAQLLGLPCTLNVISNSCVGGMDAMANAAELIRSGRTDIALAGGSDAPLSTSLMSGFCSARMLCTRNEDPEKASAPFDLRRDKGVLAEGAGLVVLESIDHARARGAKLYAEVLGFGSATDPEAEAACGLRNSMENALNNAGLTPKSIDMICAHAPSDEAIDRTEILMIKQVFGTHAYQIPVQSIKGATGNPLAAGGALQVATTSMILHEHLIPPTTNYGMEDPDCDLDHVKDKPRHGRFNRAMINSHGIGGVNSSLILGSLSNESD